MSSKSSKRITANLAKLEEFELTNSAARNALMSNVKEMYKRGGMSRITTATSLLKLLQQDKMKEFDKRYSKLSIAENSKQAEKQAELNKEEQQNPTTVKKTTYSKHKVAVKGKRSELPTFEVVFGSLKATFSEAWKSAIKTIIKLAEDKIVEKQNIKIVVGATFTIARQIQEEEQELVIHAHTMPQAAYSEEGVSTVIKGMRTELDKRIQSRLEKVVGSGWSIKSFQNIFLTTYTQTPSRGSSYIPTPDCFRNPKFSLINIQNKNNECFKYCLLYHQVLNVKNAARVSVLDKVEDKYNWEGVSFPATFNDITTFENNNEVCINVWQHIDREINPMRLGNLEFVKNDNINLLLLRDGDKGHYVYVKKIESLLACNKGGRDRGKLYCPYCRKSIPLDENYEDHLMLNHFDSKNNCNVQLPSPGSVMKFTNHKNMMERPFIVYADFECSLIPTESAEKIAFHEPNSACCYFVCTFDSSRNKLYKFIGRDCVINMVEQLRTLANRCVREMQKNERMTMTEDDKQNFKSATLCSICNKPFTETNMKVRDHCHRTGKYRGAAHNACNINYFTNRYLPIVFHNLRGYDSHLIIRKAFDIIEQKKMEEEKKNPDKTVSREQITAIPNSGEKFMTFSIGNMKFIDSMQFMTDGLSNLVESLKVPGDDPYQKFTIMKSRYDADSLDLICQKGYYPYEFIDTYAKIYHKGLPPREAFYSKVKLEGITIEEYRHAQKVYKHFKCKDFSDYHWLYLTSDVLLLADVFENFRKMCLEYYQLDPANYLTAASLAWDAMMFKTDVELELITDIEILDMFERSKRGGLTFVGSKRYAKANNKEMGKHYDKTKESSYITYVDANNLYGWAMTQNLPYKDIKFDTVSLEEILKTSDDSEIGYMVEVDLEYPRELHDKFKQYPPCPESLIPNTDWFSDYQKEVMEKTNCKSNCAKLVPHLMKHENYVIHYRNLKFIVEQGVKVTLKRVISFKQKDWMSSYINGNNKLRTEAKRNKNNFLANLFKLLNNSVFGKTMEDVRNRMNLHLTTDRENAIKHFSRIDFKSATHIDGLYLIQHHKSLIIYEKPVYIGCSILDISKLRMLDFHYNTMEANFKGRYELIYSDTDSLVYYIRDKNFHQWMFDNPDEFDLSEMDDKYKSDANKGVLGKFKSEVGSKIITEFCALSPKSYSYKYCQKECKKAKGVSLSVSDKTMSFEDYKLVLESNKFQTRNIYAIRSFNQNIFTTLTPKVVLNSFYDKMKLDDAINCTPFGYNPI